MSVGDLQQGEERGVVRHGRLSSNAAAVIMLCTVCNACYANCNRNVTNDIAGSNKAPATNAARGTAVAAVLAEQQDCSNLARGSDAAAAGSGWEPQPGDCCL